MKDVILLLTGCIKPNVNDLPAVMDIKKRAAEYTDAINFYLQNTDYKVVFCENSGTDISANINGPKDRLEMLTYTSSGEGKDRSKGYKEMEILQYVQANSNFFNSAEDTDIVVKVTGRLQLLNITKIVKHLKRVVGGGNFVSAYINGATGAGDCRFIFFSPKFLYKLTARKEDIYWNHNFEEIMTKLILECISNKSFKFVYPTCPARVRGTSGGYGTSYDISDSEYRKMLPKHKLRKLLFDIGILPKKRYE